MKTLCEHLDGFARVQVGLRRALAGRRIPDLHDEFAMIPGVGRKRLGSCRVGPRIDPRTDAIGTGRLGEARRRKDDRPQGNAHRYRDKQANDRHSDR